MTAAGIAVATDDNGAAALAVVLRSAEEGDGTVAWADVSTDIEREHWGAMLEQGVLVPAERESDADRFVLANPTAVAETLEAREFVPPEPKGWSRADFVAAVGALALLASYWVGATRGAIGATLDLALGPVATLLPFPGLILLCAATTTAAALIVRHRIDSPDVDGLRHRSRELQARLAAARARGDETTATRLTTQRQDLLERQAFLLANQLRVLVWTMLMTVPVIIYLSWVVTSPARATAPLVTVAPILGDIVWTARVVGPVQAWLAWYALSSLASSLVARGVSRAIPDRFAASA
ncbi:DUF106 domain-containing protein [Natronolimnobius sp. AArcel1]|uniref:DUF106 domain-containing protein n=1 Tax=Natronolimnobius sp. AArcel1 TaxID=1679093 RepID=UPI0013E9B3FC|nr:EMC3/TMCO1 family protein [Natronolimnobius sp. AArcel1]NGM68777.1 DUF106 domain-containing protein [Natronolimnobius sp. AArcel1]